ncbi:Signal recognition particle (SRP) receptor-alpha subunit [Komagataella phaffii GS115]|uniref:Signal recognition particle receptor subunit alpha homolog n=1 Tax=Komagataella phaffii (strain GS115 / ATCC 20864) TaxID=644223 RepID=C4R0H7_KOMPG|nr:Signal recognition particle (SRP) receptor-alpha subunit [Komagataella phaffii GS115]AOA67061.1 GQ68_00968T0 [Komagataella phaffii GS115]CAY69001.1 Signal recognition particle (SRP) receptor-alpha subunit [Komagataella phaffii GS115]
MSEQFLIFTPKGTVLFKDEDRKVPDRVVNGLISDIFISQRKTLTGSVNNEEEFEDDDVGSYSLDGYTIKYVSSSQPTCYFTSCHSSLVNVPNEGQFLKDIQTLWEELITADLDSGAFPDEQELRKFTSFYNLKKQELFKNVGVETAKSTSTSEPHSLSQNKLKGKKPQLTQKKKARRWDTQGNPIEDDGLEESDLDFSSTTSEVGNQDVGHLVGDNYGKTKDGKFLVSDMKEINDILSKQRDKSVSDESTGAFSFLSGLFSGKTVTEDNLTKTSKSLSEHLINKNVAPEIAKKLVERINKSLVGTKVTTSIPKAARNALEKELLKLLTPETSINLLKEIQSKKAARKPYVISVVGVNGVGKSTNLSKLAFWLLSNKYRVLITACDTFRSGAVEQLRVHVNNLKKLTEDESHVELFQGGYGGADLVSKIAKGAIQYAEENKFDIVLLDTAGRRHNDAQLMAPLQGFVKAAKPDKIIMVGEALVGTDSVQQAKNFNGAFGPGRTLDFFIISKCDTVGDLIGSMVNMVYATGIPILFVGTGQTYTDLRTLSVDWAVDTLMS